MRPSGSEPVKRPLILATALALALLPGTVQARPWGGGGPHAGRPPDMDFRYGGIDEGDMRRGYGRDDGPMLRTAMTWGDPAPRMRAEPPVGGWLARLFGAPPRGRGRHRPHR